MGKGYAPQIVCIDAHPGDLERYIFLGSTASPAIAMMIVLYGSDGLRCYAGSVAPTTHVASLPWLLDNAGAVWPTNAVGGKVVSITGGTVYFDVYGDGLYDQVSWTNYGVQSEFASTSANMEAISAGFRFGRISGGA